MATVKDVWRIEKTSTGWHSSFGTLIVSSAPNTNCTVNKFNAYESARHDTKSQAIKYAERGGMTGHNRGEIMIKTSV